MRLTVEILVQLLLLSEIYGNVVEQLKNGNSQQRCEAPKRVTVFAFFPSFFFS